MRARVRVNVRGVVFLLLTAAIGVAAAVKGNNLLFLVFSSLVGVFLSAAFLTWATVRKLEIVRLVPETAWAGEPFTITLKIRNGKRLLPAFALRIEDRFHPEGRPSHTPPIAVSVPLARAGETFRTSYSHTPLQRGRARFGPIEAIAEFPPAFVSIRVTLPVSSEVLVHPRRGFLRRRVLNPYFSKLESCEAVPMLHTAGDDEFAGVREFRPGDPPKRIHWKMSARLPGRLLVREYEDTRVRNAVVLLDTYLPNPGDARRRLRLERAVSFAGALVERLHAEGYTVTFKAFAPDPVEIPLEPRAGASAELYATLALLKPSHVHSVEEFLAGLQATRDEVFFVLHLGDEALPDWPGASRAVVLDSADMRAALQYET